MTSATGGGSGLTINGQWVSLQLPPTGDTTQYVPGVIGQVLTSELSADADDAVEPAPNLPMDH